MRISSVSALAIGATLAAAAAMAAATQVNVADPNATSRVAKVELGNRLAVQEVSPSTYFHNTTFSIQGSAGCVPILSPPTGKALIIRQVRVDAFVVSSTGNAENVAIFADGTCTSEVADVNPATVGLYTSTFDPGLVLPNGSAMSVKVGNDIQAEVYVDGYKVDSSVVPLTGGQTIEISGKSRQ